MYAEFKKVSKDLNISNAENLKKNATAFEGMVITSDKEPNFGRAKVVKLLTRKCKTDITSR